MSCKTRKLAFDLLEIVSEECLNLGDSKHSSEECSTFEFDPELASKSRHLIFDLEKNKYFHNLKNKKIKIRIATI